MSVMRQHASHRWKATLKMPTSQPRKCVGVMLSSVRSYKPPSAAGEHVSVTSLHRHQPTFEHASNVVRAAQPYESRCAVSRETKVSVPQTMHSAVAVTSPPRK